MAKRKTKPSDLDRRLDRLWGNGDRPARGPKPALSLDTVIQTGIEVADGAGIEAVTMGRVAEKLGVTTMALYRYVPGKEALVDLMVQAALGAPPQGVPDDWRASLEAWARADRAIMETHPWLLHLTPCSPMGPNWLAWLEAGLAALKNTGLAASEMMAVMAIVDGHVRNMAQMARGVLCDREGKAAEWRESFARVLQRVSADTRYPTLAQLVATGAFMDKTDKFEFGLQRVLDGIATLIEARAAGAIRVTASH